MFGPASAVVVVQLVAIGMLPVPLLLCEDLGGLFIAEGDPFYGFSSLLMEMNHLVAFFPFLMSVNHLNE